MMLIPSICPFHPGGFRDESESVLFGEKDKGILRYTYTRGGPFFFVPSIFVSFVEVSSYAGEGGFLSRPHAKGDKRDRSETGEEEYDGGRVNIYGYKQREREEIKIEGRRRRSLSRSRLAVNIVA